MVVSRSRERSGSRSPGPGRSRSRPRSGARARARLADLPPNVWGVIGGHLDRGAHASLLLSARDGGRFAAMDLDRAVARASRLAPRLRDAFLAPDKMRRLRALERSDPAHVLVTGYGVAAIARVTYGSAAVDVSPHLDSDAVNYRVFRAASRGGGLVARGKASGGVVRLHASRRGQRVPAEVERAFRISGYAVEPRPAPWSS